VTLTATINSSSRGVELRVEEEEEEEEEEELAGKRVP
jgi:hypothetical protein